MAVGMALLELFSLTYLALFRLSLYTAACTFNLTFSIPSEVLCIIFALFTLTNPSVFRHMKFRFEFLFFNSGR